ncbi:hypothetical protein [Pedobacter endophyticus]|uniref:Uncharacterized protein n=1 Tax=Pedobacter endophyticus TaxID=2789740 RepID=A0A7S9L2U1_9SPHI|nr:hypothetical protein [Pedobacter endophyticus]QPH41459.1 hypothetical protein IZT61_09465 [Pedobacter endophyticus]
MKCLVYPAVAIAINFVLLQSFPMAGGGASLGVLLTIPIIGVFAVILAVIHYFLSRKNKRIRNFQIAGIAGTVLISYFLFIGDAGNMPLNIIGRMLNTANHYSEIKLGDYFLERIPQNQEKIIAAKKKFKSKLPDTAYVIRIYNQADYLTDETIGIYYKNGKPKAIDQNVEIRPLNKGFELIRIKKNDSLSFILDPLYSKIGESQINGFTEQNLNEKSKKKLMLADIDPIYRNNTLEHSYFAYRMYYWLL